MQRGHAALVDGIWVGTGLDENGNRRGLRPRIPVTRARNAVDGVVKWHCSAAVLRRNIGDAIAKVPADAKLIPGHGPLSTVKELKEFHEMLVATSSIVEKAIADGKTLDQIKANGLPEKWKSWSAPTLSTSRWLEILYGGLKPK